jgi:hypothetical protein
MVKSEVFEKQDEEGEIGPKNKYRKARGESVKAGLRRMVRCSKVGSTLKLARKWSSKLHSMHPCCGS